MTIKDSSLLSCWPDGFSRYYSVSNILKIIFNEKQINILDVGGDSKWMSKFLDDTELKYNLNIVDTRKPDFVSKKSNVTYIRDDFFKLSKKRFPSDAVINTDVLEHIPKDLKAKFIEQCIQFAKSIVVLSAPQDTPEVTAAEKSIDDFYLKYTGKSQRWLKEHFEYGKPSASMIANTITKSGYPFIELNTNNLENWFYTFSLNILNSQIKPLVGMDELNRSYNENIHTNGDFDGTPYRKIFIVFKDTKLYDKAKLDIATFFAPSSQTKGEFMRQAQAMILENFAQEKEIVERLGLTEKNLEQTQKAYVTSANSAASLQKELTDIKSSQIYKQLSHLRTIKHKITG